VDAGFQAARCREETADAGGALAVYRSIWLNNPASPQAVKAQERLKQLELSGLKISPYTVEELLKRASNLYAHNDYAASLKTLEMIPASPQSPAVASRIDLRAGMARYRLKQYNQAEKQFARAASCPLPGVRSEARFWQAKSLERQDLKERAMAMYLELAGEGKKQDFADDALIEAAGLQRGLGRYSDAAGLYDQASKLSNETKNAAKTAWDSGWCRYLAGEYPAAAAIFKALLADEVQREKALYWLGRTLEKSGDSTAATYYRTLLDEFPAGFYATWHREQKGVKDTREALGDRDPLAELPQSVGYDKPRLLAALGMLDEARAEMAAARKKNADKKGQFPALARVFLEMQDYGSAISLFMQNRPVPWDKASLPLWTAGYPRAYSELVSRNAAL